MRIYKLDGKTTISVKATKAETRERYRYVGYYEAVVAGSAGGLSDMGACGAGWLLAVPFCAWKSSSSKDLLQQAPQHPACALLLDPEPDRSDGGSVKIRLAPSRH